MGETADLRPLVALLAAAVLAIGYCWGRAQYQLLTLKNSLNHDWLEPGRGADSAEREGSAPRPEAARRP